MTNHHIPQDPEAQHADVPSTSRLVPPRDVITGGFSKKADLVSYLVTGLLIGLFLDWILGTSPLMAVVWTLIGFAVGFYRLWQGSSDLAEEGRRRGHGV